MLAKRTLALVASAGIFIAPPAWGAVAMFTASVTSGSGSAVESTATVAPGATVAFELTTEVGLAALGPFGGFNIADIVLGSDELVDFSFSYSAEWNGAFLNVTPPVTVPGIYAGRAIFIGGNTPAAVGTSLALGVVTVDTTGLGVGDYMVQISNAVDGFSVLAFNTNLDPLFGLGMIQVRTQSEEPVLIAQEPSSDSVVNRADGVSEVTVQFSQPVFGVTISVIGASSGLHTGTLLGVGTTTLSLVFPGPLPDRDRYTVSVNLDDVVTQWTFVTLVGDCDQNRQVNIFDLFRMRVALQSQVFDAACDIEEDGVIDIFDLFHLRIALRMGAIVPN